MPISKIKSSGIEADSVTGSSILDGTVDTADLAAGAVTSAKLDTNIDIAGTLDVTGATTLDDSLTVGDGSGNETLTILSGSTNEGYLRFADGTSGSAAYQGRVEYDHTNGKLNMGAGGTTPVTIDSSGNMGVGTSSPASILDVTDSSTNQPTVRLSTATATNYLTIGRDSSTGHYNFKSDETGSSIQFYTDPDGTGPLNRMSIDRYGYVTMPSQPVVYRTKTIQSQTASSGSPTQVEFDNSVFVSGITYSSGNFTVPVAGKYFVSFITRFHNHSSMPIEVGIRLNGVTKVYRYIQQSSGSYHGINASVLLNCAASDSFDCYIYQASGSTQTISGNNSGVTSVSAFKVA